LLAWLPSGCLVGWYVLHSGTGGSRVGTRWLQTTMGWLFSSRVLDVIEEEGYALARQIEGPLALATFPAGWCMVVFFLILFYVTLAQFIWPKARATSLAPWPML